MSTNIGNQHGHPRGACGNPGCTGCNRNGAPSNEATVELTVSQKPVYPQPLLNGEGMAFCEYDEQNVYLNDGGECPLCGNDVDITMDTHRVISVSGWTCDICDVPVNGQTDRDGWPVMEGDSVRHTG
jgi:hypothetical protein